MKVSVFVFSEFEKATKKEFKYLECVEKLKFHLEKIEKEIESGLENLKNAEEKRLNLKDGDCFQFKCSSFYNFSLQKLTF